MNNEKFRSLTNAQALRFSEWCRCLMEDKDCDAIMDHADIFVINMFEYMTENKGINDPREYPDVAVQIVHAMESELRDYIDFLIDQEYGPDEEEKKSADEYKKRKVNLSSPYGSAAQDDFIDEGNREIYGG